MLPTIHLEQAVLKRWHGQIDMADASIIALVKSLRPENPNVSKYMRDGRFLLTRSYFVEMLPMLNIKAQALGDRLKKLSSLDILDLQTVVNPKNGRYAIYGCLSRAYVREEDRASKHADRMDISAVVPDYHGSLDSTTQEPTTNDHLKIKEADAPPLLAAGDAPSEEEAVPLSPFPDEQLADVATEEILSSGSAAGTSFARDMLRGKKNGERQRIIEMNARLLGEKVEDEDPALTTEARV